MAGPWKNVSRSLVPSQKCAVEGDEGRRREGDGEENNVGGGAQSLAYNLVDLLMDTDYVAAVRVQNRHGWSKESHYFYFSTQKGNIVVTQYCPCQTIVISLVETESNEK